MGVEENLQLMKTLDEAWNTGPGSPLWETFKNVIEKTSKCTGPARPLPTVGRHSHDVEATDSSKPLTTD